MVDPGIPLVAFVMAVINFYGDLRAGIQIVHDDIKWSKSYKKEADDMVESLRLQKEKLEQWKREWLVLNYTPETLLKHFWGEEGHSSIRQRL